MAVKLIVLNGPNINMLGMREPGIYGKENYQYLCELIQKKAEALGITAEVRQTNYEGELVTWIQEARGTYDGIVINPAAFTHYSVAVLDALLAANLPAIEVHISNIHRREEFRRHSVTAPACIGQICGLGLEGYLLAIEALCRRLKESQ